MSKIEVACRHGFPSGFELSVDLVIENRITALCGPSGSGKTTLLKFIAGLMALDRGHVIIDDVPLTETASNRFVACQQRGIGFVFQDHLLFPHKKVIDNLKFGQCRKVNCNPQIPDFAEIVGVLELDKLLGRYPAKLSGGESQRVAIARALLSRPKVLLLDEPLAAVDRELSERVADYLKQLATSWNLKIVLVTHQRELVDNLAEQTITIDNGAVACGASD